MPPAPPCATFLPRHSSFRTAQRRLKPADPLVQPPDLVCQLRQQGPHLVRQLVPRVLQASAKRLSSAALPLGASRTPAGNRRSGYTALPGCASPSADPGAEANVGDH